MIKALRQERSVINGPEPHIAAVHGRRRRHPRRLVASWPFHAFIARHSLRFDPGTWMPLYLALRGRNCTTLAGGAGNGVHPAIDRAHSRALVLSMMPGNRRRNSMAAESSPSCSKVDRIATASASVTTNIPITMGPSGVADKPDDDTSARPPRVAMLSPFWWINLWTICPAL